MYCGSWSRYSSYVSVVSAIFGGIWGDGCLGSVCGLENCRSKGWELEIS